jgi:P27 family predicted phage terminase small subunit
MSGLPAYVNRHIERARIMRVVRDLKEGEGDTSRKEEIVKQVKSDLERMKIYRSEDDGLINILAFNLMMWEKTCYQIMEEESIVVNGRMKGEKVKHPLFGLQKQFMDAYVMAANNLGIGALARKKLGWEEVEDEEEDKSNPLKI